MQLTNDWRFDKLWNAGCWDHRNPYIIYTNQVGLRSPKGPPTASRLVQTVDAQLRDLKPKNGRVRSGFALGLQRPTPPWWALDLERRSLHFMSPGVLHLAVGHSTKDCRPGFNRQRGGSDRNRNVIYIYIYIYIRDKERERERDNMCVYINIHIHLTVTINT